MKLTIEGIGTFSIPNKVAAAFEEIATARAAAEAERDQWRVLYECALSRELQEQRRAEAAEAVIVAAQDLMSVALNEHLRLPDGIKRLIARVENAEADVARLRDSEIDAKAWRNRVDEAAGVVNRLEAQLAAVRQALGGYPDSDLASLAVTLRARSESAEAENAKLKGDPAGGPSSIVGRAFHFAVVGSKDEEIERLHAQIAAVRAALGAYPDSDLVSLATTISAALSASERELEQARDYVDDAIGSANPDVPLVDRIVRLVSVLANSTTPAELDAVVDSHTVDALARRMGEMERQGERHSILITAITNRMASDVDRFARLVGRINALEQSQVASPWPLMIQRLNDRLDHIDAQHDAINHSLSGAGDNHAALDNQAQRMARRVDALELNLISLDGLVGANDARLDMAEAAVASLRRLASETSGEEHDRYRESSMP